MQTSTFLKPKTESPCRGTPVFMAPEILLEDLKFAGQEDLKKADIWALGLMMFSMINPNLSNPYRAEFEASGVPFSEKALRNTLRQQKLPRPDVKYESFRTTQWWQIDDVFKLCTQFDPESRPTAAEVLRLLDTNQPEASLRLMNLSVNQSSAQTPQDDGTNCCAFLALTICDRFLNEVNEKSDVQWDDVKQIAEDTIINLPRMINEHRKFDQYYDVSEAKLKLKELKILSSDYELSDECISSNTVFSDNGRTELINALTQKLDQSESAVAIYTCHPYIFSVGKHKDALFLVDTHPVSEDLGGNCNGTGDHPLGTKMSKQGRKQVTDDQHEFAAVNNGDADVTVCGQNVDNEERGTIVIDLEATSDEEPLPTVSAQTEKGKKLSQYQHNNKGRIIKILRTEEVPAECERNESDEEELPLGPIADIKFYDGDQRLPVYKWGLTKGMNTDDAAEILLKPFADRTLMATRVPTNISKNTVFVVDTSNLSNKADVKCDDLGAWLCTGSKKFPYSTDNSGICHRLEDKDDCPPDHVLHIVQRQFFTNKSLPSLRKSIISAHRATSTSPHDLAIVQYM
ncbi:unnamed protein product, partial [Porites lobata]